jgi:cytochrome o ubiquinol oxidase subunit 2
MSRKKRVAVLALLVLGIIVALGFYLHTTNIPVLQPRGQVGQKERSLMYVSLLLSVIVVVPVFTMLAVISLKYREGSAKSKRYQPDWDHGRAIELIWWAIPSAIILVLAIITWNSSHALDPFKPLSAKSSPMNIQVVALDWKWLFIYPSQNIATVNFVEFPVNTPVNFEITSDAPMNSFWIPQLGSQIYAMPGMSTHLHLIANEIGEYSGKSANISGKGFSGMTFRAKATDNAAFNSWIQFVKQKQNPLDLAIYNQLAKPSSNNPVAYYSSADSALYDSIVNKYMGTDEHSVHVHGGSE